MSSFDWKKNIEDSIKDAVIITVTTTELFFRLKATGMKPPKATMKRGVGICAGVLVKNCAVYKKWITE